MAFERLRAHGAAVGTVAVIAVAGLSVASLAVAQGRLKEFDRNGRAETTADAPGETVPPSTSPTSSVAPDNATASTSTTTTTTTTTVAPGPSAGLPTELFALMNADRAARGLEPLAWDERLGANAQRVSDAMAASQLVSERDLAPILALGYTRAAQHTVVTPYAATATSIEYGWIASASHRATILDAGFQHVGIGATSSPDGRIWITVDFGG